ncbi:anaerobic sulfatase maturase [Vibrio algarum]|uniref:Anaerobic sulfatase maturase n=1 Tax=Vibrio algarum TaxID=3020714 RepID=A0ABT4YRT8_9VIBR|nr:anaerobic sulfatase maturase [Vibrio sp. KJ40-1]MDB1124267.1 anaerobic sulfatase maturase [Vibrio sp. KJ40-1]
MSKTFHLMAKPTSFHCNLGCDYCFYLEKENIMQASTQRKPSYAMSDDVLRIYIKSYIASQPTQEVEFAWQGGEPTMAGLAFFEKALAYQEKFSNGKIIQNSLQTNGVLLDDKWCKFLKDNDFLIGLSIDGPEELHNTYRVTNTGQPSFKMVMRAVELLKKHKVKFNTLTVVNNTNVHHPVEVYEFLKIIGSTFHQYIPVIESQSYQGVGEIRTINIGHSTENLLPFSVDAEAYGDFMNTIFNEWVRNDVSKVYIQMFESALAAWAGYEPSLCIFQKTCGDAMVIEQNGDIYSCDHYVYNDHVIGNVLKDKLSKIHGSKNQIKFGKDKATQSGTCTECQYKVACNGGCPKHRLTTDERGIPHNMLCPGYKKIFAHIDPYMQYMAREISQGRTAANIMNVAHLIR